MSWFPQTTDAQRWSEATVHLSRVDPQLKKIIRRVGDCSLAPRRDYFVTLCKAIYSQQISTKVAATLFARFRKQFPRQRPTPALVLALLEGKADPPPGLGLSRQKLVYLRDLAEHFHREKIRTRSLAAMDDEEVIEALTAVKGVGRWTAEMFLMFVLNRPDVLPVDDLGLRDAVRQVYGLKERPTAQKLMEIAEPWRPWRSVATWYLWRRNSAGGIK